MGSHEFEEWKAEYRRAPWDTERRMLAEIIHLIHVKDFKQPHPSVREIMGGQKPAPVQQSTQEMMAQLLMFSNQAAK